MRQLGDRTRFSLDEEYVNDPDRPVLGLVFEENLTAVHRAAVRVAPWFSNLLPEGLLRDWIADARHVNRQREMELLAQVGHDLPGAVRVLPEGEAPASTLWDGEAEAYSAADREPYDQRDLRFSLAGVGIKFSMTKSRGRLTLPAHGQGGDWIVKLPDQRFHDVPRNEFAMMSLAGAVGIDVPEIALVHRDLVDERLPDSFWPDGEEFAFVIRRFDRDARRGLIHIEDLAQVRNIYPERKYLGNFETVGSLIYRRHDMVALQEFVRRLTFSILISNGDAHLKNWSLIYRDPRVPTLSPAYDLVSTEFYLSRMRPEDLGLKFGGSKDFHKVSLGTFNRLQQRLGVVGVDLAECAGETIDRTMREWPRFAMILEDNRILRDAIDASIKARSKTLYRKNRA